MLSLQYLHVWTSESRLTYVSQPGSLNSSSKITKNEITLWFLLLFDVSHNFEFVKEFASDRHFLKLTFPSHAKVGHGFFLLIVVDASTSSFSNIIYLIYTSYSLLKELKQVARKVQTSKTMVHILYTNIRVVRHF